MRDELRSDARRRRSARWGRVWGAWVWVLTWHVSPPVHAQQGPAPAAPRAPSEQKARAAFEAGRIHYENGDFLEASAAFQEAYDLSGKPDLLYNLYVAYRDANQQQKAADALRGYLDEANAVPNRPQLEARLAALEAGIASRAAERAAIEQAQAKAEREPEDIPAAEASKPPAEPQDGRWWLYPTAVMAAGGGLMVASLPTGVVARSKAKDLDSACPGGTCPDAGLKSTRDSGRKLAIATDVLLFSGVAVAVAGAVWMVIERPGEDGPLARRRVRPDIACGPGACGGSLTVNF